MLDHSGTEHCHHCRVQLDSMLAGVKQPLDSFFIPSSSSTHSTCAEKTPQNGFEQLMGKIALNLSDLECVLNLFLRRTVFFSVFREQEHVGNTLWKVHCVAIYLHLILTKGPRSDGWQFISMMYVLY